MYGITPRDDRNLGAGQGRQMGVNQMREGNHSTVQGTSWAACHVREAQTRGGSRWVGETSRWTVTLRPGKMGGRGERVKIEKEVVSTDKYGDQ